MFGQVPQLDVCTLYFTLEQIEFTGLHWKFIMSEVILSHVISLGGGKGAGYDFQIL